MKHTIILSFVAWHKLQEQIIEDYGRATLMISWRLRATLGFTVREHRDYSQDEWGKTHTIRLDFYDEQLQTLFLLKYSSFLSINVEDIL
jgi:hypothetical protein